MAWLVGILVLILAIVFWRVSLWIIGVAAVGGVLLWQMSEAENKRNRQAALEAAQNRASMISSAKINASPKQWAVWFQDDPASNVETARTASVASDDGLCTLSVEHRINGSKLTGLNCPKLPFTAYDSLEIKFDGDLNSFKMTLENYSGEYGSKPSVYIPSHQDYSSNLTYEQFIQRLSEREAFAIKLHVGDHWVRFSGEGAKAALSALGTQRKEPQL